MCICEQTKATLPRPRPAGLQTCKCSQQQGYKLRKSNLVDTLRRASTAAMLHVAGLASSSRQQAASLQSSSSLKGLIGKWYPEC